MSSNTQPTFVDIQGFIVRERFAVKEFAALRQNDENERELIHHMFLPPMSWDLLTRGEKQQATWLSSNHHYLRWNDGEVKYTRMRNIVRQALDTPDTTSIIYVKGLEKKRHLTSMLGENSLPINIETIDVDYEDIGRLNTLTVRPAFLCGRHQRNCSMQNTMRLYAWWSQRRDELNCL